jgi:transcriptional regulator with XRE-family HTH domain
MNSFSVQIRLQRKKIGISQEKLASLAAVDRTYISILERGIKSPTIDTAKRISEALGLKLSKLLENAGL